jgi:hypothetical protein
MWNRQLLALLFGLGHGQLWFSTFELLTAGFALGKTVIPDAIRHYQHANHLACLLLRCPLRGRCGRVRICIIDDEPIVVETISAYLADLGHSVTSFGSKDELD